MIVTLIYTGLSSVDKETAGMDVTPESVSCLTHVSDTLGLQNGDELKYSFMARLNNKEITVLWKALI